MPYDCPRLFWQERFPGNTRQHELEKIGPRATNEEENVNVFQTVEPNPEFPELERRMLEFWKQNNAFAARRALNKGKKKWSFLDGPITANNPMGVHHARGRAYKDIFQRFKSMQGFDLRYQNGFDCQGLWVEVEVERELGFKSKRDIEAFGIAEFVKRCKQRALSYAAMQTEQSIRLGYWMDWDDPAKLRGLGEALESPDRKIEYEGTTGNKVTGTAEQLIGALGRADLGGSYFTLSDDNNYTIWAFLKRCHERGWIYKGTDVMPWCPRCSTALSEHEIATEGYRQLTHPALTVKFPIRGESSDALLVWTTTPWTLTSNVAVAVNPEMIYVKVRHGKDILYLAKATMSRVFGDEVSILEEMKGKDIEGLSYNGPFDELEAVQKADVKSAHRVILWDEVSETEGSGLVHIAPGCGKEDFELGQKLGLPSLSPLNEYGVFVEGYGKFTATHVYDSPNVVIADLESKGILFKVEQYSHRYPVCWRCESELVFRLVDEWFISMGQKLTKSLEDATEEEKSRNLRYQIMDVTTQIQWAPAFGKSLELDWLRNMGDWMISKKRYWGLALPIWECPKCGRYEVIGSLDELEKKAVEGWDRFVGHSPHKPWVDGVKIVCPGCGASVSRISDVGNPWLDAGIVAYSTMEYFRNRSYWEAWFPADLILESLQGQFRNWFYSLLAMSTVMEDRPPCRTIFGHGQVLAEDGREMHKSLGTAIWFDEAAETVGADVMRWMYFASKAEPDVRFGYHLAEDIKRRFLLPLWNVYCFFVTYANIDRWMPQNAPPELSPLDVWILSELQILIEDVTSDLENLDSHEATKRLEQYVDDLSKWYVRRSRRRFWKSEIDADKNSAYTTLYTVLVTLVKLLGPFIPFLTEEMYQNLVRTMDSKSPMSVHHNDWPVADKSLINRDLVASMSLAVKACSLGHAARNTAKIKLRQPLSRAVVVAEKSALSQLEPLKELVKDELNVRELDFTSDMYTVVQYKLNPLSKTLGPKHGKLLPKVITAITAADQNVLAARLRDGKSVEVSVEGKPVTVLSEEVEISVDPRSGYVLEREGDLLVGLHTALTDELKREGLARDIVRRIQDQRKKAGLDISDQIDIYYRADPRLREVLTTHRDYIAAETLATKIVESEIPERSHVTDYVLQGETLRVGIVRSSTESNSRS
jgi:isoleucyl-tRNA synthetase